MKKTLLSLLLIMATTIGFSQVIAQPGKGLRPVKINPTITQPEPSEPVESETEYNPNVVYGRIEDGDTILTVYLPEVDIDLMTRYLEITGTWQGRRLVNNVRKVYPYAKLASTKLMEYDSILANASSDGERRRLMEQAENEIASQYTEELTHLTFSQGLILIRLIDRETGETSYHLVQELRGKVRAFFYQGFAQLWGYNLKSEFDPRNNVEDDEIDIIATLIEKGQI